MMKILKWLTAGFVVFFASMAANASTITSFVPTDGDVNFAVQLGTFDMAIFDNATALTASPLTYLAVSNGDRVTVDSPFTTMTNATAGGSLSVTYGNFIVAAYDGSKWVGGTGALSGDNIYTVTFAGITGAEVVVDLAPVPLPAAAWLFGTGLIGLVGVSRRDVAA